MNGAGWGVSGGSLGKASQDAICEEINKLDLCNARDDVGFLNGER
jgi:hypothetical protein